ncbi:MAG: hypothetical protein AB8B56_20130 [Crocinitomicaceae bacterium]
MDIIIMDGDQVSFIPAFVGALVSVQPGKITASGETTIKGKKVCIEGDEKSVVVTGCAYMTPQLPVPGSGTLKIQALGGDQITKKIKSGNKGVIVRGSTFDAVFEVIQPATLPGTPPVLDAVNAKYSGEGMFISSNVKIQAT